MSTGSSSTPPGEGQQPPSGASASDPQQPAAGWYQNPDGPGTRYWDGQRWTDYVDQPPAAAGGQATPPQPQMGAAPGAGAAAPVPGVDPNKGLALAGWITAILIPVAAWIIAAILWSRKDRRALPIAILALVAAVVYIALAA